MQFRILLALMLFTGSTLPAAAQEVPYVIPEFTFYKLDDTPFTRDQLTKTSNIVFVFFSTTCDHCQRETVAMGENYQHFSQSTLYFVSKDSKSDISKYMDTYGKELKGKANVNVLYDPQSEFVLKFHPRQYPSIYIYTPTRQLRKHFNGETPIEEVIAELN